MGERPPILTFAEAETVLRSKAEALALSVWKERHRMVHPSPEALAVLTDCALKGMCVGIIAGSSLLRDAEAAGSTAEAPNER